MFSAASTALTATPSLTRVRSSPSQLAEKSRSARPRPLCNTQPDAGAIVALPLPETDVTMSSNVAARNAVLANSQKRQDEKLQMREQLKRAKEKKEDGKIGGKSGKLAISSHGSLAASSGMNAEDLARESINARREAKLHRKQAASMGSAGGVSPQKQGRPSRASEGDEDHHADEPEDKAPLEPCPHVNLQWRKPAGERPAGAPDDDDTNPWRRTVSDKVLATWVKSIPSHLGGGAPMGLTTLFASAFRRVEANLKKQETLWLVTAARPPWPAASHSTRNPSSPSWLPLRLSIWRCLPTPLQSIRQSAGAPSALIEQPAMLIVRSLGESSPLPSMPRLIASKSASVPTSVKWFP